jgi:hypothetical protein
MPLVPAYGRLREVRRGKRKKRRAPVFALNQPNLVAMQIQHAPDDQLSQALAPPVVNLRQSGLPPGGGLDYIRTDIALPCPPQRLSQRTGALPDKHVLPHAARPRPFLRCPG